MPTRGCKIDGLEREREGGYLEDNPDIADDLQNVLSSNSVIAQMLLQSLNPLMDDLVPLIRYILIDHIITLRRQLLSGDEFLSVSSAARKVGVSVPTIYVWINKGFIRWIRAEGKILVSTSQVQFVRNTYYQPGKATKNGKRNIPVDSMRLVESDFGLPPFPGHLRSD